MLYRNRSEGWQYAKLTGHENEKEIMSVLLTDKKFISDLQCRLHTSDKDVESIEFSGLNEKDIPSVYSSGRKTKSKTDLKIIYIDGSTSNISIKKSLGGQVYLVKASNFIECFEKQTGKTIPNDVQYAISLFWANAGKDAVEIIKKYSDKSDVKFYNTQLRHESLNATTLQRFDNNMYNKLLYWFKENSYELAFLAFSAGAVADKKEWSEFVWYKNLIKSDFSDYDFIFPIKEICRASKRNSDDMTYYGEKNGGTTIQLPFGFVQWHQRSMQFHHNFDKINLILSK